MDKKSAIGFGLLLVLLVIYILMTNQSNQVRLKEKARVDSLAKIDAKRIQDSIIATQPKAAPDSNAVMAKVDSNSIQNIPEQITSIQNDVVKIDFTNKGGFPIKIVLLQHSDYKNSQLHLIDGKLNAMNFQYAINGNLVRTKNLVFNSKVSSDGKQITFSTGEGANETKISYSLKDKSYMANIDVSFPNIDKTQNVEMQWMAASLHNEQLRTNEMQYTQVCYQLEKEGYDYFTIRDEKKQSLDEKVKWLSFKQQFFNTILIGKNGEMLSAQINTKPEKNDSSKYISYFDATVSLKPQNTYQFDFFAGPNDYKLLKSYDQGFENIIPLSYGIFAFVKYINKWLIIPIFNMLSGFFSNYGIVIIFLTIIIRLLMAPFTYKSYVSSAKMKALKPELDELKEKYAEDKQAFGVEQMKLYRQAGVNPLGGCLPALLQLPVFFALFSFLPHAIAVRHKSFLWAKDLSTYDSILSIPEIPLYGNHVSLFTILFVITSLLLALYSMSTATMDQSNPVMKYMPFIMPVMFLGIFNSMPASLTLYYFISNLITLALQFVIQQYIIDPVKIREKIDQKKNEPVRESAFVKRMQDLQKQQMEKAQSRQQRRK